MALLTTKTHPPTLIAHLISRPRLFSNLDVLLQPGCKVALVSAPAGFGKTTLLLQWLQTVPHSFQVGWYSPDEGDNTLASFFSYLSLALKNADPDIGENFTVLVETQPDLTEDEIITYIINLVAGSSKNILLVVDDTHLIISPEIQRALEMFINHLPSNLRLVLAGRVDPSLPLPRLRARGQLIEVRTSELRFNIAETDSYLSRVGGIPSPATKLADALNSSTEGWAAGLQMTVLAMQTELQVNGGEPGQILDRLVSEISGSYRYILDYLLEEVLNREDPNVREFLLRTCILRRFNTELCNTLCNELIDVTDADLMLKNLESANLFIVPLDNQREWYRYHHLFADMLQKQLYHVHPGLSADLHHRAAEWFEQQGMIDEAIAHAKKGENNSLLRSLVEKYSLDSIFSGQITTAVRWLDDLPVELIMTSSRLCLNRAWALTFTSQTEKAATYLKRAEYLIQDNPLEALLIKGEILGLQSFSENTYGQADEAIRLANKALQISPPDHFFLQCSNHLFLAGGLARAGKLEESLAEYDIFQSLCHNRENLGGLALLEADFLHYLAMHLNARGQVRQAKNILQTAIQSFTSSAGGQRQASALFLYVALGKILFLENDLDGAEQALQRALQIDSISLSVAAFDGWEALWWVKIGRGDFSAAREILAYLERSTQSCDEKIMRTVVWTGALQDLLEGQVANAAARLARLGLQGEVKPLLSEVTDSELMSWRCNEFFTFARILAAQRRSADSLEVLARMDQAAETIHIDWVRYRVWITQAIVYDQMGNSDRAQIILTKLLDHTVRMQANPARIYLAAGESARTLLLEARRGGTQMEHVDFLLTAFPPQIRAASIPDSPETLSHREMEVLRLMAAGLKNQKIADQLVVSLNTIRYHSKNIFGKLAVDNRTAAVVRAQELDLID